MPSQELYLEQPPPSAAEPNAPLPVLWKPDPAGKQVAETRCEDENTLLLILLRALSAWST